VPSEAVDELSKHCLEIAHPQHNDDSQPKPHVPRHTQVSASVLESAPTRIIVPFGVLTGRPQLLQPLCSESLAPQPLKLIGMRNHPAFELNEGSISRGPCRSTRVFRLPGRPTG
jgi:hypothetical protein